MAAPPPTSSHQYVWDLLEEGDLDSLKSLCPNNFNWRELHPIRKVTPLSVVTMFHVTSDKDVAKRALDMVVWLLHRGADPLQKAPANASFQRTFWKTANKEETTFIVSFANESAVSVVIQCRRKMREEMEKKGAKANWTGEINRMTHMLQAMCQERPIKERVAVDSSVIEFWESLCNDASTHDVVFETCDGNVTAHGAVLTQASDVLRAMLTSSLQEGRRRRIQIKDASTKGTRFFLELLYTGTSCTEVDVSIALMALDLAHRWQVMRVVHMIASALESMLTDQNFPDIAEAAVLKGLAGLANVCKSFGVNSAIVQEKLARGELPKSVQELLGRSTEQQQSKKRRVF